MEISSQHTYLSSPFLHGFDARLTFKLHLQRHLGKQPSLRIQAVPAGQHPPLRPVRPLNRNQNLMLKMSQPTSSRTHTPQSLNGWEELNGSTPTLKSNFLHSTLFVVLSDYYSALEQTEVRLGKVQVVKPIDDGGVSMYFRRNPSSTQQSRRVVLSVEVGSLTTFLTNLGKTEEARKRK